MTEIIHPGFTQHTARLEQSWSRWHKRGSWLRAGAGIGAAALGLGVLAFAAAYWLKPPPPPDTIVVQAPPVTVNMPDQPAPQVTVNVPQQPAPIVNVTVPEARPAPTLPQASAPTRDGKTVTDFAVFHHRQVDGLEVSTGWSYRTPEDKAPIAQWCNLLLSDVHAIEIAREGRPIERGVGEALKAGITRPQLARLLSECQWFQGVNANIRER